MVVYLIVLHSLGNNGTFNRVCVREREGEREGGGWRAKEIEKQTEIDRGIDRRTGRQTQRPIKKDKSMMVYRK